MTGRSVARRLGALAVDAVMGLPAAATPPVVRRAVAVPMPDGVTLVGDLYRPAGRAEEPMAAVLIRLPYGRGKINGLLYGSALARHGFQVFLQSTRGTFGSGGHFRPFLPEHDDGLATLEWLRKQPWCDGRVAMAGGSYYGHTQWAVAPYADPPLVAISPHVVAAEVAQAFYDHGAPALANALEWTAAVGRQERPGLPSELPNPLLRARIRRAMTGLPLQAADVAVTGAPVAFWRDFVAHAAPTDPFWDATDHSRADLHRMPPVNMVTGWWDLFLPGQLADFRALRAAGNPARIVVGPWLHGEPGEIKEILRSDVAWLGHHLDGAPAPAGALVRIWLQGADSWLDLPAWPPPAATRHTHHLRADGTLAPEPEAGAAPPGRFTYSPADPTPAVGGPLLRAPGKQADQRAVEARPDVLVFTGPPLPADLDAVGPVSARVFVRTDRPHADVVVRLCDVDPDGRSLNVVDGIRRLDPTTVPAPDVTVGADGVLAVDVELFPTAYRFRAGHRLRVQVAAGAFPRFARNLGTGEDFATTTSGAPCNVEIHHDAGHASSVTISGLA